MNDGRELKYRTKKEFITDAFMDIDSDHKLWRTVCQSVSDRLDACCNVGGGHFEHLGMIQRN